MRESPILCNGAMVRAILSGDKTQTRRAVKNVPSWNHFGKDIMDWDLSGIHQEGYSEHDQLEGTDKWYLDVQTDVDDHSRKVICCPFGQPGDRLWVRETTEADHDTSDAVALSRYSADGAPVCYPAGTGDGFDGAIQHWRYSRNSRPSIHMPRDACRLVLEITDVRVERLQAISEADALAEGIEQLNGRFTFNGGAHESLTARSSFMTLWDSTGGMSVENPWVWVIEFKRVEVAGG